MNLATLGVSALIAVITTIVVEYFAKPWLEVRRETYVGKARARRELIRAVVTARQLLDQYDFATRWDHVERSHGVVREFEQTLVTRLAEEPRLTDQEQTTCDLLLRTIESAEQIENDPQSFVQGAHKVITLASTYFKRHDEETWRAIEAKWKWFQPDQ